MRRPQIAFELIALRPRPPHFVPVMVPSRRAVCPSVNGGDEGVIAGAGSGPDGG